MTEDERTELGETSAIAISHTALLGAMFRLLQAKNLLSADDINAMFHDAMSSIEIAEPANPVLRLARRELDRTARNLADSPAKRPR